MHAEFREYTAEDSEPVRVCLNAVFPSAVMSRAAWDAWTAANFSAPVALVDGDLSGAIPLKRRPYQVAPGACVEAWVEHRVGVAEPFRARGLGTGMQSCAKTFLQGRGDVLLVYRGSERSQGYRFYEKNGLLDVCYARALRLEPPSRPCALAPCQVRWLTVEETLERGSVWFDIFTECYRDAGGYPVRSESHLRDMMEDGIWRAAILHDFYYASVEQDGEAVGYLVLGKRGGATYVMELAVREGKLDAARALVGSALDRGDPVVASASPGSLVEQVFRSLGAPVPSRAQSSTCIMVRVLDIESTGRKVWVDVPQLSGVQVRVWTPEREGVLHAPAAAARVLTLELKEHMLSRLLMRRLDVACAVREERMTVHGERPGDVQALAEALRPCPWVTQRFDYL